MRRIHSAVLLVSFGLIAAPALAFDSESLVSTTKLSSFKSVYIAPVGVDLPEARSGPSYLGNDRAVSDSDAARKATDFHEDLTEAFGNSFALVSAPAAGVLTIEATLTRLQSSRPTMEDLRETPGLSLDSRYAGGADVTIAFSEAGASLGEISDSYTDTFDTTRIPAGTWEDVNRAFSMWARQLVDFVEEN
jgi:hypothetical protein